MSEYWLFRWLDKYDVTTLQRADARLNEPNAIEDLREAASAASDSLKAPAADGRSILAGRGLDLSGHLDCDHPACRKRQVDELFRRVWHYFDNIVVADATAHEVSTHWNDAPAQKRNEWILRHIGVLLYLREIGGESLVTFREKIRLVKNIGRSTQRTLG